MVMIVEVYTEKIKGYFIPARVISVVVLCAN